MLSRLFQLIHSVFGIHSFLLLEIYVFSILFQIETMSSTICVFFFSGVFLKLPLLKYSLHAIKITLCMCSVRCALAVCAVSTAPPACSSSQRFPLAHSAVLIHPDPRVALSGVGVLCHCLLCTGHQDAAVRGEGRPRGSHAIRRPHG